MAGLESVGLDVNNIPIPTPGAFINNDRLKLTAEDLVNAGIVLDKPNYTQIKQDFKDNYKDGDKKLDVVLGVLNMDEDSVEFKVAVRDAFTSNINNLIRLLVRKLVDIKCIEWDFPTKLGDRDQPELPEGRIWIGKDLSVAVQVLGLVRDREHFGFADGATPQEMLDTFIWKHLKSTLSVHMDFKLYLLRLIELEHMFPQSQPAIIHASEGCFVTALASIWNWRNLHLMWRELNGIKGHHLVEDGKLRAENGLVVVDPVSYVY